MLTAAAGGEFYDLAGPKTPIWPSARCRTSIPTQTSQWAVGWIEVLCELNGLKFAPEHRNAVTDAVARLQLSPTRTLTELSANVQDTGNPRRSAALYGHGTTRAPCSMPMTICSAMAGSSALKPRT